MLCLLAALAVSGTFYEWGPLAGSGTYEANPEGGSPPIGFTTTSGYLEIYYKPGVYGPGGSWIGVSPGYGSLPSIKTDGLTFMEQDSYMILFGSDQQGDSVALAFVGAVSGPVVNGEPESLAGYVGAEVAVNVTGGYHVGYQYVLANYDPPQPPPGGPPFPDPVPEPPGWMIMLVGAVCVVLKNRNT